jgi:plastocyanin
MVHRISWRASAFAVGAMVAAWSAAADVQRAAAAAPSEVVIQNFAFVPATLTVAPGTAVTWSNRDEEPHNIVNIPEPGQPRLFRSQAIDGGEKYTFVFDKPGTYRYICAVHPHMEGTVVVK